MEGKTKRVGIYARVSSDDQNPENQVGVLKEYARNRDWEIVGLFVETASGQDEHRPEFTRLMIAAKTRQIDVVLVWRFDRFSRSTRGLLNALQEFESLGVDFVSYEEQIDTTTAAGRMYFTVISAFAEHETNVLSERIKLGQARARREGKRIGRPPLSRETIRSIRALHERGFSARKIAERLGVSHGAVSKYLLKKD